MRKPPMPKLRLHLVPFTFHQATYLFLVPLAVGLIYSCAQQGSITGGAKDEKPPEVVVSDPPNFSTGFKSEKIEITFNEYIKLKDLAKQLVLSPPMSKKPDFKVKGKTLEIVFKDSLRPNVTYAINFGDALVDLNEENALKNFQFVFSTGATIDSLQAGGRVLNAIDNKPAADIVVMLYSGTADSLPLKTVPLYVSRTNKEGLFTLKNLAGGSYKIFALKDGNANFLFDQPAESIAFLDSLITPRVFLPAIVEPAKDTVPVTGDTTLVAKQRVDTLPVKPKYVYQPENIELLLFTEDKSKQYLAGSDRLRRDQLRLTFSRKIDSLDLEFLELPHDSIQVKLEWAGDPDTVDFWIMNPAVAARDSMTALVTYPSIDSIERPVSKTDTVKLRYRALPKPANAPKNEFKVDVSVDKSKTLEFGQSVIFTTALPYISMDTSLIRLVSGKDSSARKVQYKMVTDSLRGMVMNGLPIIQVHPRILRLEAGFIPDTAYRLTLLPGAFTGIAGQKNDSLDIRFKMKTRDQYGTLKLSIPDLKGSGIVELLDSRSKVVAFREMNGAGKIEFDLLAPGKYTARLVIDSNRNGRWDTGRYSRHVQPEKVITFSKELTIKANWEVSETWEWEDL